MTLMVLLSSCTPKNIAYFQDAADIRGMAVRERERIRLEPEDRITINVNSNDKMLMEQFNLKRSSSSNAGHMLSYTVDDQGDITFPVLGKLPVAGKTRMEVAEYIEKRLIERGLAMDAIVTVEFSSLSVTVLGSVGSPGKKYINSDHYTILDAIAASGDLDLSGLRKNVMVCRQVNGEEQTYFIDLTSRRKVLESPAYFLKQNDVIYVEPTNKVKRSTTNVGNTFHRIGWWVGLPSTIISLYFLFKKL